MIYDTESLSRIAGDCRPELLDDLQYLGGIFDSSPDGVAVQHDERIVYANPAFGRLFGATDPADVLGRSFSDFVDSPDLERVRRYFNGRLRDEHIPRLFEFRARKVDGEIIGIEASVSAFRSSDNEFIVTYLRDISETSDIERISNIEAGCRPSDTAEQKAAEVRRHSEEHMSRQALLFDAINDGVLIVNLDGKIIEWNPAAERMFGYSRDEIIGKSPSILHPQHGEMLNSTIMQGLSKEDRWRGELAFQRRDGSVGEAETVVMVQRDAHGKAIATIGVNRDITEQKRVQAAMRESEARFHATFERAGIGIALIGLDGYVIDLNPALQAMLGYTADELKGTHFGLVNHPEDFPRDLALLEEMNKGLRDSYQLQKRYIRKDGSIVWANLTVSIVKSDDGSPMFAIRMIHDISERLELEEQLRQSQKMEAVGRLAGGIAHDFNNLLTAMGGYSDLVLRKLGADDPLRHNVEGIKRACDRAANMTHQLLAFSRKQILQPRLVNLNDVLLGVDKMLARLIGDDIDLTVSLDSSGGVVYADPGQLEQIIINLVVNARDAMPLGGSISLATQNTIIDDGFTRLHPGSKPGHYVVLSVSDTGVGMDPEVQKHIFEPFFTTKEIGKGTGLGLATVYGIINQSGGYITVDSKPGKGAVFSIYLPISDEPSRIIVPRKPADEELPAGTETVLLAEDGDLVRGIAITILEMSGYKVLTAVDGQDAIAVAENYEGKIDLLLTDVVMPGMNGRILAEHLKRTHPFLKVLYMSGYTEDQVISRGVQSEGMAFLQKPFSPKGLARKVREVLDGRGAA